MASTTKSKPKGKGKHQPASRPKPRASAARLGDNTLEGRAQPFVKRIERLMGDLDSERGTYMSRCKPLHEDIREVYSEAKDHGVAVKALRALIKWRELEKKQAGIGTDFDDIDERAAYDQLVEALGPLGFAAARAAGFGNGDARQPAKTAPTPTPAEPTERSDESELARLGRGSESATEPEADVTTAH